MRIMSQASLSPLCARFKPSLEWMKDKLKEVIAGDEETEHLEDIPVDTSAISEHFGRSMLIRQPILTSAGGGVSGPLIDESELTRIAEKLQQLVDSLDLDTTTTRVQPTKCLKRLKGRKIAEALQSEAAFTTAKHKKHIVATYGCGPCVAVGGYDSTNKIAFVVHFATEEEVIKCGGKILHNIERLLKKKIKKPIKLHLRGGVKGTSEKTIEAIKSWMTWRSNIPMKIASKDILDDGMCLGGKSLSINAKNGRASDYDPLRNPKHREITDEVAMRAIMSAFTPNIRISHRPNLKT